MSQTTTTDSLHLPKLLLADCAAAAGKGFLIEPIGRIVMNMSIWLSSVFVVAKFYFKGGFRKGIYIRAAAS